MKTLADFKPEVSKWLIEDWFPLGHRIMDTAPEGSFKTMLGCWVAVCIAAGIPIFGHEVTQGPVLIVDEETPEGSLDNLLIRFSKGIGCKLEKLPIWRVVMTGFRFGRKTEMDKLLKMIEAVNPVFIRMDSLIAMLPSGRQALNENDCHLGETIRDDLINILNTCDTKCSILLSAHSKKYITGISLHELEEYEMSRIVRGHGSIVGEGCDTGLIIKKISERDPTRFAIMTRPRRQAIPADGLMLIELEEEHYGEGWARLKRLPINRMAPTSNAKSLYPVFNLKDKHGQFLTYKEDKVMRTCAFKTKAECKEGVTELLRRKVLVNGDAVRSYTLNPYLDKEADKDYLDMLRNSHGEVNV